MNSGQPQTDLTGVQKLVAGQVGSQCRLKRSANVTRGQIRKVAKVGTHGEDTVRRRTVELLHSKSNVNDCVTKPNFDEKLQESSAGQRLSSTKLYGSSTGNNSFRVVGVS